MKREGPHAGIAAERIQMYGKQRIGGLGLAVSQPSVVASVEVQVVPADWRIVMGARGHRDHPCAARERRPKPVHERKVAKMVGCELGLPSLADAGLGARHDPGAVDDDVGVASRGDEALGKGADALQVGQVELVDLGALDAAHRLTCRRWPPRGDDDMSAGAGQRARRFQAESGMAAGDDRHISAEIRGPPALPSRSFVPQIRSLSVLACRPSHASRSAAACRPFSRAIIRGPRTIHALKSVFLL